MTDLSLFALLVKGTFSSIARAPGRALGRYVLLPIAAVCFFTFLHVDATVRGGWPMLAVAGSVWLLFVNSALDGGMALWRERWLLRDRRSSPWLLLAAAETLPVAVFGLHIGLVALALAVRPGAADLHAGDVALAALIAAMAGVGVGCVCARASGSRRAIGRIVPPLLLGTLVLTPVLYRLSALESLAKPWCTINPICTATEVARRDIALEPPSLVSHAAVIAFFSGGMLLCAGLLTVRRRPGHVASGGEHALVLRHVTAATGLVDASIAVDEGEIVVAIGPRGGGKEALLQVASGVQRPRAGAVEAIGDTASFLEPRSGLHSGLSGRNNLVLRALSHRLPIVEANTRADAALAFAELDGDGDAVVAMYSEESLARVAFAAMAFFGDQVLIWDDVLLSRYPSFRQKCLALIPALLADAKAILMASDDVGKLAEMSGRALLLDAGQVHVDGPSPEVLARHLGPRVSPGLVDPPGDFGIGGCRVAAVELLDADRVPATCYLPGDPITVAVELELERRFETPYCLLSIAGEHGSIAAANMFLDGQRPPCIEGTFRIECRFDGLVLAPGHRFTIRFALYASDGTTIVYRKRAIASFIVGGSAAALGFTHEKAEGRILTTAPVLATYSWRLPGANDGRAGRPSPFTAALEPDV